MGADLEYTTLTPQSILRINALPIVVFKQREIVVFVELATGPIAGYHVYMYLAIRLIPQCL